MTKSPKNVVAVAVTCFIVGLISGVYVGQSRGIPLVGTETRLSIGIYTGESPFDLAPSQTAMNPVLTARHVTDVPAKFVADPFMMKEDATWHMFFEVWNTKTAQGDIGYATSNDGLNWTYGQIVLDELFHLSYPYVFKWRNEHYMIPESREAKAIRLYRATDFPTEWVFVRTLLAGKDYADPSVLQYGGKWWIFAETNPYGYDTLRLYYADRLEGAWIEHPKSPIILEDANIARPGGRVLTFDGRIVRYAQDDYPTYGNQVWAFEITELTPASYEERQVSKSPILEASGIGWNAKGMHHIDPHQIDAGKWIASVDGFAEYRVFGLGY